MFKVRVIEKEFKIKLDDAGNELSRSVWDESIYFIVMSGPRKQDARLKAKGFVQENLVHTPTKFTQVSVGRAYKCDGTLSEGTKIEIPVKELV